MVSDGMLNKINIPKTINGLEEYCEATDFAVLTGLNRQKAHYFTYDKNYNNAGIRPLIDVSFIPNFNKLNNDNLVYYGEMPMFKPIKEEQCFLKNKCLIKTVSGFDYNSNNICFTDNSYYIGNKQYVKEFICLLNNQKYVLLDKDNNPSFIKIEAIPWYYIKKKDILISKYILMGGIAFKDINNYLTKYLEPHIFVKDKNDIQNKNILQELSDIKSIDQQVPNGIINAKVLNDEKYDKIIGRNKELERLEFTLLSSKASLIIGESGVGKTTLVKGLVNAINKGNVPEALLNKKILAIKPSSLKAGCIYRGMFSQRIITLFNILDKYKDYILFIDDITTLINKDDFNIADYLISYLEEHKMIAITTNEEYANHIKNNSQLNRRFATINVDEVDDNILMVILLNKLRMLSLNYKITCNINNSLLIKTIIYVSKKENQENNVKYNSYTSIRHNPDLAIEILENVFIHAILTGSKAITKDDLLYAINNMDTINSLAKEKSINNFNKGNSNNHKLIKFPNYDK